MFMTIRNFSDIKSLLLSNIGVKQTIVKNTFWLAIAEGFTRFLKLFLIIYVARILGATEYGKFTFALAFISLFIVFSHLGISAIATRELSREKGGEKEYPAILSLKIVLSIGTLILILIGSFFITTDPLIQKVIWILAIYFLIIDFTEIIYVIFRARQKMEYESFAKILQAVFITAAGFFIILNFPSVENLSYGYLFASLISLIFVLLFFHFKIFHFTLFWNTSIWKKFLGMSWPIALVGIFGVIYGYIDSIMMGHWGQITETGWYNAAAKVAAVTSVPMILISQSFYPVLSKFFKESKEKLQRIWNYQMELMIILAVPIVVGGITLASKIIDFIYDPSYNRSILAFQILVVMAGLVFLCHPFNQLLIAVNQQKKFFWISLIGAIVNITLNLILIPRYSLYGAAITTVITYFILLILFIIFTKRFTPINPLKVKFLGIGFLSLFSGLVMYFVISLPKIYNLNVLISVLVGALIYFATLLILRTMLKFSIKVFRQQKLT